MISRAFFLLLGAAAMLATGLAQAQQYRWIDKDGHVQYTDAPPPAGARDVRKSNIIAPAAAPAPLPFELVRLQKDFPVTLYTSPSCKEGCELARDALSKRGIPFKEVQVWNAETNEELKTVSGAVEVPTLLVGRSAQRGFEPGAFDALLDSAGYPKVGVLPAIPQKAPAAPEGYQSAADTAKPVAEPETAPLPQAKPGRYDTSGLKGPAQKPGPYGIPGETK